MSFFAQLDSQICSIGFSLCSVSSESLALEIGSEWKTILRRFKDQLAGISESLNTLEALLDSRAAKALNGSPTDNIKLKLNPHSSPPIPASTSIISAKNVDVNSFHGSQSGQAIAQWIGSISATEARASLPTISKKHEKLSVMAAKPPPTPVQKRVISAAGFNRDTSLPPRPGEPIVALPLFAVAPIAPIAPTVVHQFFQNSKQSSSALVDTAIVTVPFDQSISLTKEVPPVTIVDQTGERIVELLELVGQPGVPFTAQNVKAFSFHSANTIDANEAFAALINRVDLFSISTASGAQSRAGDELNWSFILNSNDFGESRSNNSQKYEVGPVFSSNNGMEWQ